MLINWLLFTLTTGPATISISPMKMTFVIKSPSISFSTGIPSMSFKLEIPE